MNLRQFLAAGLTIASLGGLSLTAHAETGRVTLGDLNADGFVDAIDASMTLAAYANISTEKDSGLNDEQYEAADANYDGFIDAVDASLMLSYYAYVSTGGEKSFGDYLSDPPTSTTVTTTALTTTQTTTATTEPPTQPPVQNNSYPSYYTNMQGEIIGASRTYTFDNGITISIPDCVGQNCSLYLYYTNNGWSCEDYTSGYIWNSNGALRHVTDPFL